MNNEIKEILDKLNKNKNEIKDYCYYPDDVLSCDDLIKLLDYITNLQELNETSSKEIDNLQKHCYNQKAKIKELQEENERLKGNVSVREHNYKLLVRLIENGESMTQKFETV